LHRRELDVVNTSSRRRIVGARTWESVDWLDGPFGYLKKSNFNPNFDHRKFVKLFADEVEKSKEDFVRHYKRKYSGENHLPVWMATEILTFGSLSVLYSEGLSLNTKRNIAHQLGEAENVVTSWMQSLTYIRNLCAHHCRVWNRDLPVSWEGG
jgi:abortive infection bacteriophage resistance protein